MKIRINKFLSQSGVASRREADVLIENKKVKINGKIAKLGDRIDEEIDVVKVEGDIVKPTNEYIYYALNKPVGYTSTVRDEYAEKTVIELVPRSPRVYPVGRLDKNSHGLMVLTNDGELANRLTHPRFKHEKEYVIKFKSGNSYRSDTATKMTVQNIKSIINKFQRGVRLEEGSARFDKVSIINIIENDCATIKIILHQGWKRQIRRMFQKLHLEVIDLLRTKIAKLNLADLNLKESEFKIVRKNEIL